MGGPGQRQEDSLRFLDCFCANQAAEVGGQVLCLPSLVFHGHTPMQPPEQSDKDHDVWSSVRALKLEICDQITLALHPGANA